MVMPDCQSKNTPSEISIGYISLQKYKYADTDTMQFGYVISPNVRGLEEVELEVSPDNSPSTSRPIRFRLEYTKDGGVTWDDIYYIEDDMLEDDDKYGYVATFNGTTVIGTSDELIWEQIVADSEEGPIKFRVRTVQYYSDGTPNDNGEPMDARAQYIRVHKFTIKTNYVGINSNTIALEPFFTLRDNTIESLNGEVTVYNIVGQIIDKGERITLMDGVYIVESKAGISQKVIIK
jgi:hypothetical protein